MRISDWSSDVCSSDLFGLVDEGPGGLGLDRHVGEHPADALVLGDTLAEGLPVADELERMDDRALGEADPPGSYDGTRLVQRLHYRAEALAFRADPFLCGTEHVLEEERVAGHAAPTHLVPLAADGE